MNQGPSFSTFASFHDVKGKVSCCFCCSSKPRSIPDAFIWAKSLCENPPEAVARGLEVTSFQIKRQFTYDGDVDTLLFIAATKVETIEERLNRLSRSFEDLKKASDYLHQDNDACIRGLAAEIKKTKEDAKIDTTVYYTEPGTEAVKTAVSNANTFFYNPDGRLLLLPNGKSTFGYKNLARPSIYSLGRWPENSK